MLPPDPFGDVPADPMSEDDIVATLRNRELVEEFRRVLGPAGYRGVSVDCEACDEVHLHDWELLIASMSDLLAGRPLAAHEPAHNPDPSDYVPWDYCCGFVDGCDWGAL